MRKTIQFFFAVIPFSLAICCPAPLSALAGENASPQSAEVRADRVAIESSESNDESQPAAGAHRNFGDSASAPGPQKPKRDSRELHQLGVGIRLSTLGAGAEVAASLTGRLNLRGGFNYFAYDRGFNHDGITYKGQLNLGSGEIQLDWFPFRHGFHLSPGLLVYNGNGITANANVPGNSTFTLGSTAYLSDPANPIAGKGKLDFVKAAPIMLLGFGNLVPRTKHFSVDFEMGAVFQGSARTALKLTGGACDFTGANCVNAATDPMVQANILAEQTKLNNKLSPFKYYPVISMGFGYRF